MGRWVGLAASLLLVTGCADPDQSALVLGRLRVFPADLDFQQVALHDSRTLEVQLKNLGRAPLSVQSTRIEAPEGIYEVRLAGSDGRIIPGASYPLTVSFAPRNEGVAHGNLWVQTDGSDEPTFSLPLRGAGVLAAADIPLRRLDFGRIEAQSSKSLGLRLRNPSTLTVEVSARVLGADRDEFSSPVATLRPGEERTVPVEFSPERVGKKEAALAVTPCKGCPEEPVALVGEALDRALVAEPPVLDFGQVPVDRQVQTPMRLHNISTEPVTVLSMGLANDTDSSFAAPPQTFPQTISAESVVGFDHRYSPEHMGDASGAEVFGVDSRRNPTLRVGLAGHGGAAELCVSPTDYDFGSLPVGSRTPVVVTIRNCGASDVGPLTVAGFALDAGDAGEFNVGTVPFPQMLAAGAELRIKVFYEPTRQGGASATYRLQTSALGGDVLLKFTGTAQAYAPCNLALKPGVVVDFGTLPPGQGGVLGVKVTNLGADLCAVKNIHISNDGGGIFVMPGGVIDGIVLRPGDYFSFQVAVRSHPGEGTFAGSLTLEPAATPLRMLPLQANVQNSCLVVTPPFLDFGLGRPDCPLPGRQVNFRNTCTTAITISHIFIGPGTTDALDPTGPEFRLDPDPPHFPPTVAPGVSFSVDVDYRGLIPGMNLSPLFVRETGLLRPHLVPLLGESSATQQKVDQFVQQDGSKVDVLFVVDNSDSMNEEQAKLIAALPAFASEALTRGVDMHVGFTTTGIDPVSNACPGGAQGGEAGRFFPINGSLPRMLTQGTAGLAAALQAHAKVGLCASVEQGFEAIRRAFTQPLLTRPMTPPPNDGNKGFLRDEAALAIVLISDEDDHSPDDVVTYAQFLRDLKGAQQPQRAVFSAIAPTPDCLSDVGGTGDRYAEMTTRTAGQLLGSCKNQAAYADFLSRVAQQTFSPQNRFPLSAVPEGGVVTVSVNGVNQTTGWTYDAGTNAVVFATRPAPGSHVDISYRPACAT